jgi:hypothetical protein
MIIIGQFLMLLMVRIHGQNQIQTKNVADLANFVGVKVPDIKIQISSWMTEDKKLIVDAWPSNAMYVDVGG